jgi:CheY-like chemotaxis protein
MSGHTATIATDGRAALDASRKFQPEFVLLDLRLPDTDGYSLLRRLRSDGAHDATVVAYTGSADDDAEDRIRRAGFDAYLAKPVDLDQLMRLLAGSPEKRHSS